MRNSTILLIVLSCISITAVPAQETGSRTLYAEFATTLAAYQPNSQKSQELMLWRDTAMLPGISIESQEYIVGPRDQFGVYFVADDVQNIFATVNSSGRLFVKSVGAIDLSALTLENALQKITATLQKSYSGLDFEVELTAVRFASIQVLGAVKSPGIYYAPAVWRVSEVIELAGGLAEDASPRNIVMRGNGADIPVDLVRFNMVGDLKSNPMVCKGNMVFVPLRRATEPSVSITGLVNRPDLFSIVEGDQLGDYIAYAGGVDGDLSRMDIVVTSPDGTEARRLDGADPAAMAFTPGTGDNITLLWKDGEQSRGSVWITGAVGNPGRYPIPRDSFSVNDLLAMCGGASPDGYVELIQVYRTTKNHRADPRNEAAVEQADPGTTWLSRFPVSSPVGRNLISNDPRHPLDLSHLALTAADSVHIPTVTGMVSVTGAVAAPGMVRYEKGRQVDYYIQQAGGMGYGADRTQMVVINPYTGAAIEASGAGELFDGEIIFVPRKEAVIKP